MTSGDSTDSDSTSSDSTGSDSTGSDSTGSDSTGSPRRTTYRSCNLCEAICGLTIQHDDRQVFSIKGDPEDPLSRGHLCPKAIALQDIHADPDRLRQPMRNNGNGGFEPISWDDAFDLLEERFGAIRAQHGDDAVAIYLGNPTVHNSGAMLFQRFVKQALNTKHQFSATSVDQLPHHYAANHMFGHGLLIPVPDIDHTEFMLILGGNPAASNGSLMTAPDVKKRLSSIRKRGGKIVLIDPRATETSKLADQHHFIRPGTDAYLLAAILNVIFSESLTKLDAYDGFVKNVDQLEQSVGEFTPASVADETGISAKTITELAREFAAADRAVVYGRIGVSTQQHGGVCNWLINAINLVTGNLDRQGGQMFSSPAVSLVGRKGTFGESARWHSRVRGLPEFEGEFPVAVMAEEMLTPGNGQIRSLITNAGNPVLSTPNGQQVDIAIAGLDFYVAIDIYINETTRHADLILPSATGLETDHFDLAFNALAIRNTAKYSSQVFKPDEGAMYDWQIMKELAKRLTPASSSFVGRIRQRMKLAMLNWLTPDRMLNIALSIGPYGAMRKFFISGLNLRRLKASPHGVDFGELKPQLPRMLRTPDRKVDAAPPGFVQRMSEIDVERKAASDSNESDNSFSLIGRRHLRSNNSWMHNSRRLMKGPNRCTLMMHPDDASRLELESGSAALVSSRVGSVSVPVETTDAMMPGVVSLPHGYGHNRDNTQLTVASESPGVSINDLMDDLAVDPLTGNAAFSGQRVSVTKDTATGQ